MREFDGFVLTHFLISGQVVAHFNINFGIYLLTNATQACLAGISVNATHTSTLT